MNLLANNLYCKLVSCVLVHEPIYVSDYSCTSMNGVTINGGPPKLYKYYVYYQIVCLPIMYSA